MTHTKPGGLTWRWFTGLLFVVLLIGALGTAWIGSGYQRRLEQEEIQKYPPPGELVEVGEMALHLYCQGTGSPVVILEAGGGDSLLVWSKVQPEIAKFTRVCSYDRAGVGWSEEGKRDRSAQQRADELYSLLKTAQINGPYILVGHSLGGLTMQAFAASYPEQISGMVLLDSTNPFDLAGLPKVYRRILATVTLMDTGVCRVATPIGLVRSLIEGGKIDLFESDLSGFPEEDREVATSLFLQRKTCRTLFREQAALGESVDFVIASTTPGDYPLAVLVAMKNFGQTEDLLTSQGKLLQLSNPSWLVQAKNSGHYIQLDEPELVIQTISKLVNLKSN